VVWVLIRTYTRQPTTASHRHSSSEGSLTSEEDGQGSWRRITNMNMLELCLYDSDVVDRIRYLVEIGGGFNWCGHEFIF